MNAEKKLYLTMMLASVGVTAVLVVLNYTINHTLNLPF